MEEKYKRLEDENKGLKTKLDSVMKKDFDILQKLDLDEYGITSDDLRSDPNKKHIKGVDCKGHPLVPKLDFDKIYAWREQQDDVDDLQDDDVEESEEEEELMSEHQKFMFKGSELQSSASMYRRKELEKRKEDVIGILNKTYADDETEVGLDLDSFKDDEVLFHDVATGFQKNLKIK